MYAVGKVLYTVASPFHPFGGAVDIVVVQQQDGSFKSSPWYVRFGKFQGVLKTTEKVVSVAVNGAEAGFHMYLDSNGEAHFLRDADSKVEEGDFVVSSSLASLPGDAHGREVPMQDAQQLRKSKSTSCDILPTAMEANVGDGSKVLARRRSILERMFGRKSVEEEAHVVDDRASSLERAEIAAQLLDTKWSTNLSSGLKACGSKEEPSSSSHVTADAGDGGDQAETTKTVLPDCSFDHEKAMGSNGADNSGSLHGRWSPGDDNEDCVQNTSVKEEIVEIYEGKTGDLTDGITSTTEQPGTESMSNDLGADKSIDGSVDTQAEPQGDSEDVTTREICKKEVLSHGMFEINAIEIDVTNGKSEAVSQFVAADLDGLNQKFTHTYSPTYSTTNLSSERHDVSDRIISTVDQPESESWSNDLGTDKSINVSIDIQGELQGNSQNVTTTVMHSKEVLSHANFEIHAIETNITNGKSEAISQFVVVDSDGVDQNFTHTYSPTYITSDEIHAIEIGITNRKSEAVSQFVTTDLDGLDQKFTHTYSTTYSTTNLSSERHDVSDGITSMINRLGSESWSKDLGTDKSINVSIDIQGELRGNSADVTTTEMHTKKVPSHGNFEIHAIETNINNGKSQVFSQFVVVDSHGVDQNFTHTYSPIYISTDLSSERHDISDGVTSMIGQLGSESLSYGLDTDKSMNESIDIQGELRGNYEDFTSEICTKEVLSHGLFEIQAIETGITNRTSEAVSQFVTTDLDGLDQNFTHTYSPTCSIIDLSSEMHDVSDGVTLVTDQPRSQYLSNGLGTDKSISESIGIQGEFQGNSEDVTGREICTKEVLSHGTFGIHAIETDITNEKREMISQFVVIDSDGVHQNFTHTNSTTYNPIDLSSERHDVSLNASSQDACQDKVVIMSSSETVERSYNVYGVLLDATDISLTDGVQSEKCSGVSNEKIEHVIFEERPLSYHGTSSNKEDTCSLDVRDQEVSIFKDSSSQVSQDNVPNKDISMDTIANDHIMCSTHGSDIDISVDTAANDHSTHSTHDLACQHDLVFPDASSSAVEILSNVHENNVDDVTKDYVVETKTCNDEHYVSDIQTLRMEDGNRECIAQIANFPNKVDDGVSPINSDFSSLRKVEVANTKLEDENRSSSASGVEIGLVPEEPRDEAEAVVSFSEFVEEIQFQFSDNGSFSDRNTVDDVAGVGVHDESNDDPDEEGGDDASLENKLENHCDLSRPGSELHSSHNNLEAKSLPNLHSHIHDLERSDSFQLSSSLQHNGENNGVDPAKITTSGFLEQEPEGTGDSKENSSALEPINNPEPDDKHADDLEVDSFNPFAELSLCRHLLSEGMGADAACKAFDAKKITLEKFRAMKQTLITNNKLVVRIKGRYFPWDVAAPVVLGMVSYREEQVFEPQGMIKVERVEPSTTQGGSWRIWPFSFRRTRTINTVQPVCESTVESSLLVPVKESGEERNTGEKRTERKVRSLTPTSEELSSLDLKEGRNVVTFTFSTAMLGRQQVDAHIYVWKWNTRIVISDVDGTITKSDVLGQFMPMVGVDWSQTGVAHLFSAIKENGYQLLFLSARSISQAHLTRQFLFNLQQDGKTLPDGPVVISPDGLFPSLYREVIRRAPHEFKISCLAVIKALFPPDSNPFYAGFGNRDTDELSYLKVGIPMGKIFIINPKGEVAVNRRVDTKSYTSLHVLVNGMFPPISSSSEEEDYNTWNYWKMPLPAVDI